jgi:hypothetical protein
VNGVVGTANFVKPCHGCLLLPALRCKPGKLVGDGREGLRDKGFWFGPHRSHALIRPGRIRSKTPALATARTGHPNFKIIQSPRLPSNGIDLVRFKRAGHPARNPSKSTSSPIGTSQRRRAPKIAHLICFVWLPYGNRRLPCSTLSGVTCHTHSPCRRHGSPGAHLSAVLGPSLGPPMRFPTKERIQRIRQKSSESMAAIASAGTHLVPQGTNRINGT